MNSNLELQNKVAWFINQALCTCHEEEEEETGQGIGSCSALKPKCMRHPICHTDVEEEGECTGPGRCPELILDLECLHSSTLN